MSNQYGFRRPYPVRELLRSERPLIPIDVLIDATREVRWL